jgi:AraC-like DNA-binding protein
MFVGKRSVVVKPDDGFDHWHQVTCRDFSLTECRRVPNRFFRAQVAIHDFGALKVNTIWSQTAPDQRICVERSAIDTRRDPRDYFMLWLALKGEIVFAQGGRVARMTDGDLTLHDQGQPFSLAFAENTHALMVSIPRPLLMSRIADAPNLTAHTIVHSSKLAALAGAMLRQLVDLDETRDDIIERLGVSTLDVLATTLSAELTHSGATHGDERLRKAKRYLLANMESNALSLESIAQAQNMSARTLNRLFALDGTTPMRWLWDQRLLASYRALTQGDARHVTDAAYRYGFSDVSHFSRAFKARFGRAPHTLVR